MLHLRNIVINKEEVQAEYSPEDSGWWGCIRVNLSTNEMNCDRNLSYGASYPGHAKWKLLEIAKSNDDITECTVMWY